MAKKQDVSQAKAITNVAKKIKPVEEASQYAKVMVYGRNKTGKTVFASTAEDVLIIDVDEEGTRSAHRGAKVIEVRSFDEVAHVYWYLKAGNHGYKAVAIDTITALHASAIRKVLGEAEDRDPTRERATPDRRIWGRANQLVNELVMDFRNLPMHVIYLAQERVIEDEDTDEPALHTVNLPAGARGTALGCVGLIGRIFLKELKIKKGPNKGKTRWTAVLLVGPHEQYDTGNRLQDEEGNPLLPPLIKADMKTIIEAWGNHAEEE